MALRPLIEDMAVLVRGMAYLQQRRQVHRSRGHCPDSGWKRRGRNAEKGMMSDQGVVPDVAEDGVQARERCAETDFDLIVTDGQMTHMNGAELSSRVRARETSEARPRCRTVALTASIEDAERQRYMAASADEVLCRPIREEDMASMIRESAALIRG